ncbi:MAG: Hsp70 family protein, partial [Proteobacteria bacterium]|nr:Hsp70 family protein [Pseudomonadota bacterium]
GIDLGTTNSVCAIWKDGKAELISNRFDDFMTPSVVSIEKGGKIHIGQAAKTRAALYPKESVKAFKRYMGTDKTYKIHGTLYTPVELSSLVIKRLVEDAEGYLEEKITEAIISVPAYFNNIQRSATKQAAELAGLKVDKLINEPTAAAIAYGLQDKPEYTDFMIVDLGGGTFDVSIMEYFEGVLEVKASGGDNFLGGEDFTQVLIELYLTKARIRSTQLDAKAKQKLYYNIEQHKRQISSNRPLQIEPFLDVKADTVEITYDEYKKVCEKLLQKISKPIERCLRDSGLEPVEIDEIILVGGSSRMGFIKSMVTRMFKKIPRTDIDPDLTIAVGAAIQAGLKAKDKDLGDIVLTDVSPFTLGTGIVNDNDVYNSQGLLFSPIIERNTTVPASRVKSYVTVQNNQKELVMDIYQGESRLVKNNIKLGSITVNVPKAKAGEEMIELRFSYDINGLLDVDVFVPSTGERKLVTINNAPGELTEKEIQASRTKLAKLKIHPKDDEKIAELIMRAESIYENSLEQDRVDITHNISLFEAVLERQDPKEIERVAKEFRDFLANYETNGWFE